LNAVIFGEVNAALTIFDRLKKIWGGWRNRSTEPVSVRFVKLFESHGVHRNQIPRFIGGALTLKDVRDDASLLDRLDDSLLEAACAHLAVRREWLDGADTQVHPCHDFYKRPEKFSTFLDQLQAKNPQGQLAGVLIAPSELSDDPDALIVLEEQIATIGEKPIHRYHLLNNWAYTYWKARVYLTACIAIAWKRNVYIRGITMPRKEIDAIAQGHYLLGWKGEGMWALGHKSWHPEDMALEPSAFLKDVDPERDNFGIKSGLAFWLELDRQGLMDWGFGEKRGARQLFEAELAKYAAADH
jgi:hypothetical protein